MTPHKYVAPKHFSIQGGILVLAITIGNKLSRVHSGCTWHGKGLPWVSLQTKLRFRKRNFDLGDIFHYICYNVHIFFNISRFLDLRLCLIFGKKRNTEMVKKFEESYDCAI